MEINTTTIEYPKNNVETTQYVSIKKIGIYEDMKLKLEEIINNFISPIEVDINEQLNNKFLQLDFGSEFDIDASKIGVNDAIFFVNLLNQNNIIDYSVEDNKINLTYDNKTIQATNSLLNMLQTSLDTKKPIRLDFDKDITVILKLDKEGKIQAHFIPGSSAVENYLKNNIPSLKQSFDEQEINYSYLGYSQNKNNNQKKRKKEQ